MRKKIWECMHKPCVERKPTVHKIGKHSKTQMLREECRIDLLNAIGIEWCAYIHEG